MSRKEWLSFLAHAGTAICPIKGNLGNAGCPVLLSTLLPQTMLLADRGYDADGIRELARPQGAWANIPPKRNRKGPICFSRYPYRAPNLIERFFNKQCRRVRPDMTSSRPTIWPSSNSHQSAFGYALMSRMMASTLCLSMISGQTLRACPEGKPVPPSGHLARRRASRFCPSACFFADHALVRTRLR
jgi:transposase